MARARCVTALLVGALLLPSGAAAQDFESRGFRLATPSPRESTAENLAAGKALYEEYCEQCHGAAGDGQGLMADLLDPRPRDFRRGVYKIRTTIQGELPTDLDLFQIVGKGMPGTSMPEWQGILSDEEIWQVVDYIKSFSEDFADYPAEQEFLIDGLPEATPESIALGAEVYVKAECAKCHGESGRGDGPSASEQEDEWGNKIWPADLTQPWALRGGSTAQDLYRTLTTGANGTPMPSFSDAWAHEDLAHLSNYVESIGRAPVWGEIVRGTKTDSIPHDPFAPTWDEVPALDVRMAGQIVQRPRLFNPSVQSVNVRALFDDNELALLITWHDRFHDDGTNGKPTDQVSVFFPARELEEGKKPYFLMGDRRRPVDGWQWTASGETETFLARGMDDAAPRPSSVTGVGAYQDGQYRVILRRSLAPSQDDEVAFTPGQMIPIAWNIWDGDRNEEGKQRAISRWYYLLLEPETPLTAYIWPIAVIFLAAVGEMIGLRALRRRWANEQPQAPAHQEVRES